MNKKITGQIIISKSVVSEIKNKINNIPELKKRIELTFEKTTTEILENILSGAIKLNASDIHIEPKEKQTKIRFRIDGILQKIIDIDKEIYKSLVSRIKLLAGLKLNIFDQAQDGRFSFIFEQDKVEVRTSSLPAEYGESIVLRILNPKSLIEIESLGLRNDLLSFFLKEIKKPNGMIISAGPTGSGKTTTLYAFLKKIQRPEIKIITIEDPIEYHLSGISQTQIAPEKGYDFANGLRSIMRQDPDVILVGEIRDSKTAKIATQAALTGHLVLSTLHANDAAGAISRLINLGIKPSDIGPSLNMIIAQRLIRKICKKCGQLETISKLELEIIKNELKNIPKTIKIPSLTAELKVLKPKKCNQCNSTGYNGRMGIFESILINEEIENFILENPSTADLKKMAINKKMVTIKQDGLIKILNQETTMEEVERIVGK